MVFLLFNLVGQTVCIQTRNGKLLEGIFHTLQTEKGEIGVVMKWIRELNIDTKKPIEPLESLVIKGSDIVQIKATDIIFATEKEQYRDESKIVKFYFKKS